MLEFLNYFFSHFIPQVYCYLWNPGLLQLYVLSDSLIALAYYSISLILLYFVQKRQQISKGIFLLFGAFIITCGTVHLIEIWTLWHPSYWLSGLIKAITAVISLYTAILLVKLIPQSLERFSTTKLETTNETLQNAILDSANYTIISTNEDGVILTFNTTAEKWLGYSAQEVVGKATPVIFHDWNEVVSTAQELSQELDVTIEPGFEVFVAKTRLGQVNEREWTYIRKDGSHFPVLLSITALRDVENNVIGFLGIGSDITTRKATEKALRESERRYASLAQAAPVGIFSADTSGRCLIVNERACEIVGFTPEEAAGEGWIQYLHPDDRQRVVTEWNQATQQNLPFQCEYRFRDRQGKTTWVLSQAVAEKGSAGEYIGYVGTITDISDRKRAEEELRHLSNALTSAVEGISQLDTQGRYIKVNPAYANIVGYEVEEIIGMAWELTVHPDDREKLKVAYQQMLINGKVEVEAKGVRKDNSLFDKQIVMVKAYDQQKQFIGHYCFMKDISDRREVERLKDEFVSVVNHELRTPLTSISGALDLLASGVLQNDPEDAQRMLNIAATNTDRLVRLINDILDIERIESGKVQISKQLCNAADLMTQSVEFLGEMAEQAGVTVIVSPLSVPLWADPDRIIQVLTNLLSNAIKFSSPGSTVWLSAEEGNGDRVQGTGDRDKNFPNSQFPIPTVLFQVKDEGRGIPADKLESIFERFGQVDASDSRQKGGTGLGLAICRSILQHHGGEIWAESTLGEGSTFFFTLSILTQADKQANTNRNNIENFSETFSSPIKLSPLILECDDDPDIRVVIQTTLEQQGYRVLAVASGAEAIEQATVNQPDVIILNLLMPGMDGWETLAILKQQPQTQNIPVIILSGLLPDLEQRLPEGITDWIVKPPDFKLLCQMLEKATAKQHQSIKVLIIEDDQDLAQVLIALFDNHDIITFWAETGREAIHLSQQVLPDLLVLDLGLPECNGFAVVDWLRQHNRLCKVPLVVYTAQDLNQSDRERLKLGQTLFFTKGRITPQEVEQRVINLLNRMIRG